MTTRPATPASPTLGSSLLSQEKSRFSGQQHRWLTGLASLDNALPATLWTSGKVIGIVDDSDVTKTDRPTDAWEGLPLLAQIIVTHLASVHDDNTVSNKISAASPSLFPPPSAVYVIGPHSSASADNSPVSPTLLAKALNRSSLRTSLLDAVSLLQYFDFAGLADAVGEVSKTLLDFEHLQPPHQPNTTQCRATSSILILDGLVPTLSVLARKSGPVATNALLTTLLRSLTRLSRDRANLLVLITLEPVILDSLPAGEEMSAFSSYADKRRERRGQPSERSGGAVDAGIGRMEAGKGWATISSPNASSAAVLGVLVTGIDTLVLIHTVDDKNDIVEVLTDRVGGTTGRWGVR